MKRFLILVLLFISNNFCIGAINYNYQVDGESIPTNTSVKKQNNAVYTKTKKSYEQSLNEDNDYRPYPLNMFDFGSMPSSNSATGRVDYGNFMPRVQLPCADD